MNAEKTHAAVLAGKTAGDLMTPNPVSIEDTAAVEEAIALLTDKGFSAAPVIDEAGHPVGVLSRTDLLTHECERIRGGRHATAGGEDPFRVRDLMTPALFGVAPDTPAAELIEEMVARKVHQLFVVDADGVLVGVVTALDVLRQFAPGPR
jgi:CBS domain-containing protein